MTYYDSFDARPNGAASTNGASGATLAPPAPPASPGSPPLAGAPTIPPAPAGAPLIPGAPAPPAGAPFAPVGATPPAGAPFAPVGATPPAAGITPPIAAPPVPGPPAAPGIPIQAGPAPVITANRRRIDNRFPVLGFSIRTQGRPWFEVLLTTDRTLLDPANAARRTAANFFAGRQDGGLARATAADTAYIVPAAVLRRFASAHPRPREIFYTVAAYVTPDGPPVLAQPAHTLTTAAPSVQLSGDFQAQTMATVLGIPAEKLQPAPEATGPSLAPADPAAPVASPPVAAVDGSAAAEAAWLADPQALALDDASAGVIDAPIDAAEAWAHGGGTLWDAAALSDEPLYDEDPTAAAAYQPGYDPNGYAAGYAAGLEDDAASAYEDGFGATGPSSFGFEEDAAGAFDDTYDAHGHHSPHGYDASGASSYGDGAPGYDSHDAFGDPADSYDEPDAAAYGTDEDAAAEPGAALGYDDGFGTLEEDEPWTTAQARNFPDGAAEPGQLEDVDDRRLDEELAFEDDGYEPYGDAQADATPDYDEDPAAAAALATELDIPAKVAIITKLGRLFESSQGYAGINADTEFSTPRLSQYQRWHVGLSYGLVQFTQDSGGLGQLLTLMRQRDAAKFREVFGAQSDELVEVTNRTGPSGAKVPGGRSVRVQPVGGADLWQEPWVSRFRAAAAHPPFQAAQNELAVRRHLDPMLGFATGLGLTTERGVAILVDRSIQMGVGGARRWLITAIGPVRSDAQRQQALGALGFADLRAFQQSVGLPRDGEFGPLTHAAITGALRRLGAASPVPIPTLAQLLDAIVARADSSGVFWRERPRTIRSSAQFGDAPLTWPTTATR